MTFRKNRKWAKATKTPHRGWVVALGWANQIKAVKVYTFGGNRALAASYVAGWLKD